MTKVPRGEDPSAEVPRRSRGGGRRTLECCFSLNMDAVNVNFVRDLVVTQGKKTFTSQFVATRSISWKERLKFAVR